MKLAFLISAHTDAPQLKRLIGALPDNSVFFVHIDRKSDMTPFSALLAADKRVRFIKHRVSVVWGSINEVEYQMELVRAALLSDLSFDYLITLSGMDYPVWEKGQMLEFFDRQQGHEFLCGAPITMHGKGSKLYREYRLFASLPWKYGSVKSKFRVLLRKTLWMLGFRKPLTFSVCESEYNLYKGAAWWAISPELAAYILGEWDKNDKLVSYFKTSFCPAETFAQTVAFNNKQWRNRCIVNPTWEGLEVNTPLTFIHYHPVMKILTEDDYDDIVSSGKMFARKIITGKSDKLVTMLLNQCNKRQIHANEQ